MPRTPVPFVAADIAEVARFLAQALAQSPQPLSHVQMLNLLARAVGYRNYQALRAATPKPPAAPQAAPPALAAHGGEALRCFNDAGVLLRWPTKQSVKRLCLWALWARLPARDSMTERQISARLNALHTFADAAILRRDMVGLGLLSRTVDGASYLRIEQAPPDDARALIRALRRDHRSV
jgi:hypothetical protein